MAILQGWVNVDPASGSGNKVITVSASEYTGRTSRNATLSVKSANLSDKIITVTQKGKPTYIESQDTSADKNATEINISGYSNAEGLKFIEGTSIPIEGTERLDVEMPYGYELLGTSYIGENAIPNGTTIPGDPGAHSEYEWSMKLIILKNNSTAAKSVQIIIEDYKQSTIRKTITITQSAGDPYLNISIDSLELEYTGETKSFDIQSNTSWTIN